MAVTKCYRDISEAQLLGQMRLGGSLGLLRLISAYEALGVPQLPAHSWASQLGISEATYHRYRRKLIEVELLDSDPDIPPGRRQRPNRFYTVRASCEASRAASQRRRLKHKANAFERERYWAARRKKERDRRYARAEQALAEFRQRLGAEFHAAAEMHIALAAAGREYDPWAEKARARQGPSPWVSILEGAQGELYSDRLLSSEMPVEDVLRIETRNRRWRDE